MTTPEPSTFAEGQRRLYGIAVALAGIGFGLAVLLGGCLVLFLHWGAALQPEQLHILAGLLVAGCINTTIVIIGLLVGGPVGRFRGEADIGDRKIEIEANSNGGGDAQ